MLKHRKVIKPEKYDENDDIETESDSINDNKIEEEDDIDGLENSVNGTVNKTFINHLQVNNSEPMFKCESCEFRAFKKSVENTTRKQVIFGAPFASPASSPRKD